MKQQLSDIKKEKNKNYSAKCFYFPTFCYTASVTTVSYFLNGLFFYTYAFYFYRAYCFTN